jgi:hypothetical protein
MGSGGFGRCSMRPFPRSPRGPVVSGPWGISLMARCIRALFPHRRYSHASYVPSLPQPCFPLALAIAASRFRRLDDGSVARDRFIFRNDGDFLTRRNAKDLSSRRRASELGDRVCILCLPPDFSAVPHYSVHTQLSLRPSQNRACAINAHGSSQCLSHAIPAGICMLCDVVSWPLYSLRLSAAGVSPHRLTLCRLLSSGGVTRLLRYYETIRLPMPDKLRLPC